MEGKTGRTKGKENTCRTVGITKALADRGHSTARKGFFYFFALKFGYSIETKKSERLSYSESVRIIRMWSR